MYINKTNNTFVFYKVMSNCGNEYDKIYIQAYTEEDAKKLYANKKLKISQKDCSIIKDKYIYDKKNPSCSSRIISECFWDQIDIKVSTIQSCKLKEKWPFDNMYLLNNKYLLTSQDGYYFIFKKELPLDNDNDFLRKDKKIYTVLKQAIENNKYEDVHNILVQNSKLLNESIDYTTKLKDKYYGNTVLITAIDNSDIKMIKMIIENFNVDVNKSNISGYTPLIKALGKNKILNFLLQKGADVNKATYDDCKTPLMFAVENNDIESIKILLNHGANAKLKDTYQNNALHYLDTISDEKDIDVIVKILIEYGANLYAINSSGETPLKRAESLSSSIIQNVLLKYMKLYPK